MTNHYDQPDSRRAHANRTRFMRTACMLVPALALCVSFATLAAGPPPIIPTAHVIGPAQAPILVPLTLKFTYPPVHWSLHDEWNLYSMSQYWHCPPGKDSVPPQGFSHNGECVGTQSNFSVLDPNHNGGTIPVPITGGMPAIGTWYVRVTLGWTPGGKILQAKLGADSAWHRVVVGTSNPGAPKPAGSQPALVAAPLRGAVLKPGSLLPVALAKPRLTINSARASLNGSCDLEHSAVVEVSFSVTNHDAPLVRHLGDEAKVHADELPGSTAMSAATALPSMAAGQTWRGSMPLGMGFPNRTFPGQHHLLVSIGPRDADPSKLGFVPPKPYPVTLDVPAGYCQPKTIARPSGLTHPHPILPQHLRPIQTKPKPPKPVPSSGQQPRVH